MAHERKRVEAMIVREDEEDIARSGGELAAKSAKECKDEAAASKGHVGKFATSDGATQAILRLVEEIKLSAAKWRRTLHAIQRTPTMNTEVRDGKCFAEFFAGMGLMRMGLERVDTQPLAPSTTALRARLGNGLEA